MTPRTSRAGAARWLDHGGVYAIANLRGGGEFGEAWHKARQPDEEAERVRRLHRAAAQLADRRTSYTQPDQLAIQGGSNGGLLMGAALTQHPELFRAVVSHVGIYDMLRVELRSQRRVQRHRVRHGEGPGAVPRAVRLLAVSPREGRHGVSRGAVPDRRERRPRRPDATRAR